ncbi:MAG: hypothetical protein WD963_01605 [Candidatus Paceibacterota bacterium]
MDRSPITTPPGAEIEKPDQLAVEPMAETQKIEKQIIIDDNLAMMKDSMQKLLMFESMGGNAGSTRIGNKHYSCAVANGYVDNQGKIMAFGNIQDLSQEIITNNNPFSFRVAVDMDKGFIVLEILEKSKLNPVVVEILNACKNQYNHDL